MTKSQAIERAKLLATTPIGRMSREEIKELHTELKALFVVYDLTWQDVIGGERA